MLYSIQLRPALFLLLTLGAISLPSSPRMAIMAHAAVAALLGPRNLPIVLAGPYDFKVKTDLRKTKASKLGRLLSGFGVVGPRVTIGAMGG
jgi:hypothetical protein